MQAAIIIPVYNHIGDLRLCLDSINATTPIIPTIVNDASDAYNTQYLMHLQREGKIKLIQNDTGNAKGFSYACNRGLKEVKADYYILLNSDTIIGTNDWISRIERALTKTDAGIYSVLSNSATSQTLNASMSAEEGANFLLQHSKQRYPLCNLCNGFCYIIKRSTITHIGYFDEEAFPHYGSEDDYSMRAKRKRIQLRLIDDVFIWHKGSVSYTSEWRNQLIRQSIKAFLKKYGKQRITAMVKTNDNGIRYLKEIIKKGV